MLMREMKRNKKRSGGWLWLCICLLCFASLAGCFALRSNKPKASKMEESGQMGAENQAPLLVFYGPGTYNILLDYQQSYPEVKMIAKQIHFQTEKDELAKTIEKYGQPDIILLGENDFNMLGQLSEQHLIADMNPLLVEDESVEAAQYFPNTFEVFQTQQGLFGLPLGVSFHYMTLREENWQSTSLANLPEYYTAKELLNVLIEEAKKPREKGWYLEKNILEGDILEWMYQIGGIWAEDGQLQVDEEALKQVYTYYYLLKGNQKEADEYYEHYDQEATYDESKFVCASGLDHYVFNGKVLIDMWQGAPQIGWVYAKSTNLDQCGQETYAYWIPKATEKGQYLGKVNICGAVGGQSSQQQRAYQTLRHMMDIQPQTWIQPMSMLSDSGKDYCPVNLFSAKKMIRDYNALNGALEVRTEIGEVMYTMERQRLNEAEIAQFNDLLDQVSGVYIEVNLTQDEKSLLYQCFEKGGSDYHLYYETLVKLLNERYV